MASVPLRESVQIVLSGTGSGTAKVGPISAREVWHPSNVAVSANAGASLESACSIYVGLSATQSNYRDGTVNGSAGDSTDKVNADTVRCGEYIWAVWSGGNAGVTAVLSVTGTKDV